MAPARLGPWLTGLALTVLFLFLAGVMIIRATGFRFDPQSQRWQETGIISLTVKPEKVVVSINGQKSKRSRSLIKLTDLLPGRYEIEVTRAGHFAWNKSFQLSPGQAIVEPLVTLFLSGGELQPATPAQESLLKSREANLKPPDSDFDLRGTEIWVKPLSRTYPFTVVGGQYQFVSRFVTPVLGADWLPGKTHLLFQLEDELHVMDRDGTNDIVIVRLRAAEATLFMASDDHRTLIFRDGGQAWQRPLVAE